MMAARSGHGGRNSIDGGQGVSCADWVGASWRGRSVGRMAGQRAGCRRQAGNGRARLNWVSQGQRWGRCKVRRRAERVSRPAIEKKRRRRVLVVTTGSPRPMRAVQRFRLCAITWTASQAASYVSRSLPASADGALPVAEFAHNSATVEPTGRAVVLSVIIGLAMMRWPCGEPVEQPSVCCRVRRDSGCDCRSVGAIGRPMLCRTAKVR